MNATPVSSRLHIGIFGRRNAGKSCIINALTNQPIALVSPVPGTTTDPVFKTMELLPIGPIVLIDTAGIDDEGALGNMRIERSYNILNSTDLAILVIDGEVGVTEFEISLLGTIRRKNIPVIGVLNKMDLTKFDEDLLEKWQEDLGLKLVKVSASEGTGIDVLKQEIIQKAPGEDMELSLVGDLVKPGDFAVLVAPIDTAAPKGRLILPQQQVIRDILDHDAVAVVTKEHELKQTLENLKSKPAVVITDSQAFSKAAADTPEDIYLTSFSIIMARHKGDLTALVNGAKAIDKLKSGDRVLIAEGCTHHRQSDDIGRVKIPRWLREKVGVELEFQWFSGKGFPSDLENYKLIIHCGACMLNRKEMLHRLSVATEYGVPMVNYGVLIAYIHGILPRVLQPFPPARTVLEG
ncbi:MAG: [FeFe] hydrogenase H-cluster maturation GTPase HydF [Bacillota bacterium]